MKRTKKYEAGLRRLHQIQPSRGRPKRYENDELYQLLENKHQQVWDNKAGEWSDRTQPRSMFGDDESTGIVRIRVMAHPHDVQKAVRYLQGTNFKIVETSDEYPNRKGNGVRVYVTAVIGE